MPEDLTKKAAKMLLKGATLLSDPCPYCRGVRVMKDGQALCISCGREPEKRKIPSETAPQRPGTAPQRPGTALEKTLESKLESLTREIEQEKDHKKQQEILKSINTILDTIEKIKKKQ